VTWWSYRKTVIECQGIRSPCESEQVNRDIREATHAGHSHSTTTLVNIRLGIFCVLLLALRMMQGLRDDALLLYH